MPELIQTEPTDPLAQPLLTSLAAEYRARYGLVGEIEYHPPTEFRPPAGAFLVAVSGGETVAGGALRRWSDGIGEIKRMWTSPAHRRRGHGARVLAALEQAAVGLGYRAVRLGDGCAAGRRRRALRGGGLPPDPGLRALRGPPALHLASRRRCGNTAVPGCAAVARRG